MGGALLPRYSSAFIVSAPSQRESATYAPTSEGVARLDRSKRRGVESISGPSIRRRALSLLRGADQDPRAEISDEDGVPGPIPRPAHLAPGARSCPSWSSAGKAAMTPAGCCEAFDPVRHQLQ